MILLVGQAAELFIHIYSSGIAMTRYSVANLFYKFILKKVGIKAQFVTFISVILVNIAVYPTS